MTTISTIPWDPRSMDYLNCYFPFREQQIPWLWLVPLFVDPHSKRPGCIIVSMQLIAQITRCTEATWMVRESIWTLSRPYCLFLLSSHHTQHPFLQNASWRFPHNRSWCNSPHFLSTGVFDPFSKQSCNVHPFYPDANQFQSLIQLPPSHPFPFLLTRGWFLISVFVTS